MDVTIVVATFGSRRWVQLAETRALPSARRFGVPVVHHHAETLHDARNGGVAQVDTEWVCHLDADDELEDGFFDAMATGAADVRAPAVRYVRPGVLRDPPARVPNVAGHGHDCSAGCLPEGNWLVIGSLVRTELVRDVGGWRDFAWSEDWDLWLRCHLAGASFEAVPDAVYRAWVNPRSRNRSAPRSVRMAAHQAILAANGLGEAA